MRQPCVDILSNRRHGTLYVGVTSDVVRRVWEHRTDAVDGFGKRYRLHFWTLAFPRATTLFSPSPPRKRGPRDENRGTIDG